MTGELGVFDKGFASIDECCVDGGTGGEEVWPEGLVDGIGCAVHVGGKGHQIVRLFGEDHDTDLVIGTKLAEESAGPLADLREVVFHAAGDIEDEQDIEGILITAEVVDLDWFQVVLDDQIFGLEVDDEAFFVAGEEVEPDLRNTGFEGNVVGCLSNQTK